MRLLFVTYRFPDHTSSADRNTVYNLIKYFGRRHEVSLVAPTEDSTVSQSLDLISSYVVRSEVVVLPRWRSMLNVTRGLVTHEPLQMWYFHSAQMRERILQVVHEQQIDLIYGYHLRSAQWLTDMDRIPRVIAIQPAQVLHFGRRSRLIRNPFRRLIYTIEHQRLIGYELAMAKKFNRCLLISEKDRLAIDPNKELKNVFYNPHGTNVDAFAPPLDNRREPASLVFTGAMSIDTNQDAVKYFIEKILPIIWKQRPDVKFYVVGKDPPASISRLARDSRVIVTGFVKDIRPYLWRGYIGVDPIRIAAGMQNKVLEGMAAGLPMVISPEANEGIGAPSGDVLIVASNPSDFARSVIDLLENPGRAQKLSVGGQHYVREYWSWEYHFEQLEQLFEDLVETKTSSNKFVKK